MPASLLHRFVIGAGALAFTALGLWAADIVSDRRYVIEVEARAKLYEQRPVGQADENPVLETLRAGQAVKVLRVRKSKGIEAIQVRLPSGSEGWVVVGEGVKVVSRGTPNTP